MERVVYQQMAELDDRHWWYRARRKIIADLIRREARLPAGADILEIGCGTGHNLAMLAGFGHVEGLELDDEARALSEKRLGRKVMSSPLPELAGVPDRRYDLIGAFDVIEHIEDDSAALASIATKLKPGGKFVMTVPAHQWMWTAHDTVNHHKRRYSKGKLRELIETSPLKLERLGYFNSLLFPLAVAERNHLLLPWSRAAPDVEAGASRAGLSIAGRARLRIRRGGRRARAALSGGVRLRA